MRSRLADMQPICTYTIGDHSRKLSHAYPVIRLLRAFCKLVGAAATVFETTHNGELAVLVVISPNKKISESSESSVLT